MFRLARVARLFGRVEVLQRVVLALSRSISGIASVAFLLCMVPRVLQEGSELDIMHASSWTFSVPVRCLSNTLS